MLCVMREACPGYGRSRLCLCPVPYEHLTVSQSRPTCGIGNTLHSTGILVSELNQPCHIEYSVLSSHIGVWQPLWRPPEEGVLVVVGKPHQHLGYNTSAYSAEMVSALKIIF